MSNLPRAQHILASAIIAEVGLAVAYISYTQEPAEAFVFPRLISTVFAVLAVWTFAKACMGRTKVGQGVSTDEMWNLMPGLFVLLNYVFWAANALGFYTATTIAVFLLLSLYDPAPNSEPKTWIKRVLITAGFMAVMYGLFAVLLNVFTPREIFS